MQSRIAKGGRPLAGAKVGILMTDLRVPRVKGDVGNAETWPFPVLYKVLTGLSARSVVFGGGRDAMQQVLDGAKELVDLGADGITTSGGFCSIWQKELAAHTGIPVVSSSLMQIPVMQNMLPEGKRVGVITIHADALHAEHLVAAGAAADTPIVGLQGGQEFSRKFLSHDDDSMTVDFALVEQDLVDAGRELLSKHPEVGAVVLECHNLSPYARRLQEEFRIPFYSVYTAVCWFHSGLVPRDFGYPSRSAFPDYAWQC